MQAPEFFPLSPLQTGFLAQSLERGDANLYRPSIALVSEPAVSFATVEAAWRILVARHDALRTRFLWEGLEQPVQIVEPDVPARVDRIDLSATDAPLEAFDAEIDHIQARALNLAVAPCANLLWADLGAHGTGLIFSYHHILMDGWSSGLILRDLADVIEGRVLPDRPTRRFSSYVAELFRQQNDPDWRRQAEAYWRAALDGYTPARPPWAGVPSGVPPHYLTLPLVQAGQTDARQTAAQMGITISEFVAAATACTMAVRAGTDDLAIGMPISTRGTDARNQGAIGLYLNTVPLRYRLPRSTTFRDAAAQGVHARREMKEYARADLRDIATWSTCGPAAELFDTLFVSENYRFSPETGEKTGARRLRLFRTSESLHYPVTVRLTAGAEPVVELLADPKRVSRAFAPDLRDQLAATIATAARNPDIALASLPRMGGAERTRLLSTVNDTARAYDLETPVHVSIRSQADLRPDAVAVRAHDGTLTYTELIARVDRLARGLAAKGVCFGDRVGLLMRRSTDLPVAMLAILQCGAAYVPIELEFPEKRKSLIATEAALRFVLVDPGAAIAGVECCDIEELARGDHPQPAALHDTALAPAYVMFTSGSTGTPKGVEIGQRGLLNRLHWMQDAYGLTPADVVLQKTPYGFDVSVWEFLWPLMIGAELVLAAPERHMDPRHLQQLIADLGVTVMHFVPSVLTAFLGEADAQACGSLRMVFCSGEALPTDTVHRFHRTLECKLHNLYGPTEASIDSTYWSCPATVASPSVPIGSPIANTEVYVLDDLLQPVAGLTPGQICIGGAGLAHGYINLPCRTAVAFVPDPFSRTPGGRLYLTGDLGRWRPDGTLEYLGRQDDQVKLRGMRLELGEVEAALRTRDGVRDAVAIHVPDSHGGRLVAFCVGDGLEPRDLRRALLSVLPRQAVPSDLRSLEAFPRTASGKIDRKELAKRATHPGTAPVVSDAPADEDARVAQIVALWRKVLDRPSIAPDDNFFELGGDSIRSIFIASEARKAGLQISATDIHRNPTPRLLADSCGHTAPAPDRSGREVDRAPLTPAQAWFMALPQQPRRWNMSYRLTLRAGHTPEQVADAVRHLCGRHAALRQSVSQDGTVLVGQMRDELVDVHDHAGLAAAERKLLRDAVALRLNAEIDPFCGQSARFAVIWNSGDPGAPMELIVAAHHLVSDVVSWRLFVHELGAVLAGDRLPPPPPSVFDWTVELARWAQSPERVAEHRRIADHWLSGMPAPVAGGARLRASEAVERHVHVPLDMDALDRWSARLQPVSVPETLLLTALGGALDADRTGHRSVVLERAGRSQLADVPDNALSFGWFTAFVPFTLPATDGDCVRSFLAQAEALKEMPDGGVSFAALAFLGADADLRSRLQQELNREICVNFTPWNAPGGDSLVGDVDVFWSAMRSAEARTIHPLELDVQAARDGLALDMRYDPDRVSPARAEALLGHLCERLANVAAALRNAAAEPDFQLASASIGQSELAALAARFGAEPND